MFFYTNNKNYVHLNFVQNVIKANDFDFITRHDCDELVDFYFAGGFFL
jgi:hypothetical protein